MTLSALRARRGTPASSLAYLAAAMLFAAVATQTTLGQTPPDHKAPTAAPEAASPTATPPLDDEPRRLPTSGDAPGDDRQTPYDSIALAAAVEPAGDFAAYDQRLAALEEKYAGLADENAALKKSLKGYAQSGHSGATMKVNGRIHADMWNFPESSAGVNGFESGDPAVTPQDRLGFRRMRFGVKGKLPYNMLYKIEMEFAGGSNPEFRDAYLGWDDMSWLHTVLIGNQKRPYGLDHLNSSRYNVFIERPFVIEAINQDARRFGVCSYGLSDDEAWNWRYGVFNQRLIQDEGNYVSDHLQGQIAGRLANTIWYDESSGGRGYAHWALAGTWADTDGNAAADNFADSGINEARFRHRPEARTDQRWLDTGVIAGADDYSLLALEGLVNIGPTQLVGEYQRLWLDRNAGDELDFHGGYVYLSYFLTGEHIPWERKSGTLGRVKPFENFFLVDRCSGAGHGYGLGAWQVAVRWSYADFSDQDIQGGVGESVTLGLNWHWTPYARMQFNYIYGDIEENADNAPVGAPVHGTYQIVGTRVMVDF
ncbi:Phosphate-selective porin O and P [Pseudobythopirellula maris]|uniref:Phosphate-selective porin O and P n=1 Tax=Pseudobythopirellula maris TaxID=2527991 RepID=A0A5C5ZM49_9BACT|nr:porin [Pseudobythopirellula maris]TWT88522.1 Phosphate-selective porin O and P [Pseudobythopirellula maris]